MRNWSETIDYSSSEVRRPQSLAELISDVGGAGRVKALGSRHSFNEVADTTGMHVSLDAMPYDVEMEADAVWSGGGMTHSELSFALHRKGRALPNLASLPHISVAGAIQTGTHGSGARNAALSDNVLALSVVTADGEDRLVSRSDGDFGAVVVGLGAFGVVHRVLQRTVPAFDVRQSVHQDVPWDRLLPSLETVMAGAYSVSLFTRYASDVVEQVWVKERVGDPVPSDLAALGGRAADRVLHPLPDTPADNVNEQLRLVGPSHERLPHFRHEFKPGRGDEIQSEYMVDVAHAAPAIEALRSIAHSFAPLLHVAEIRRIARDDAWLSPTGGRDSVALHFTWHRDPSAVRAVVAQVEEVLLPLGARPHWGKQFTCDRDVLRAAYPRFDDFVAAVDRWDPAGTFSNAFLDRVLRG